MKKVSREERKKEDNKGYSNEKLKEYRELDKDTLDALDIQECNKIAALKEYLVM